MCTRPMFLFCYHNHDEHMVTVTQNSFLLKFQLPLGGWELDQEQEFLRIMKLLLGRRGQFGQFHLLFLQLNKRA